jgi:hypothetical protein
MTSIRLPRVSTGVTALTLDRGPRSDCAYMTISSGRYPRQHGSGVRAPRRPPSKSTYTWLCALPGWHFCAHEGQGSRSCAEPIAAGGGVRPGTRDRSGWAGGVGAERPLQTDYAPSGALVPERSAGRPEAGAFTARRKRARPARSGSGVRKCDCHDCTPRLRRLLCRRKRTNTNILVVPNPCAIRRLRSLRQRLIAPTHA